MRHTGEAPVPEVGGPGPTEIKVSSVIASRTDADCARGTREGA
jgi:hypothetical protein